MKTVWHVDADQWTNDGPKINSRESLDAIQEVLEHSGNIIVEHRHYRAGRAPDYLIFTDFKGFEEWLEGTTAGDSIWIWDYGALCRDDNAVTHGKAPDETGKVPLSGAY
ncbi:MAG: hypothetical protein E6J40_11750 [Chloroflexi bacterium]|nr:MAG: hypothetical protein E6J40_11750 [Chloroflexota bacterium]